MFGGTRRNDGHESMHQNVLRTPVRPSGGVREAPIDDSKDNAYSGVCITRGPCGKTKRDSLRKNLAERSSASDRNSFENGFASPALRLTFTERRLGEKSTLPSLTLTDLVYDYLKILTQHSSHSDEGKDALDGLACFLSTGRDTQYYINLEKKLKPLRISFTRELHLKGAIIAITRSVIAEANLEVAHKKHVLFREKYWDDLIARAMQLLLQLKENKQLCRVDVQTVVTNLSEQLGQDFFQLDKDNHRILSQSLTTYLKFQIEQKGLVQALLNKLNKEDSALVESSDLNLDPVAQDHSIFIPIDIQTYTAGHIQQKLALYRSERVYFASTTEAGNSTHENELENDLESFLTTQLENMEIVESLTERSQGEREDFLKEHEEDSQKIEEAFADIKEPSVHYDNEQYATQRVIENHPRMGEIGKDSSVITGLVAQVVSLLLEDFEGNNALDLAIQSKNLAVISKILAYAMHTGELEALLHVTLQKLRTKSDREGLLFLIGGAYLFDPKCGGFYNPAFVRKICEYEKNEKNGVENLANRFNTTTATPVKGSRGFQPISDDDELPTFFNQEHQLILSDVEQAKINDCLLKQADDENFARIIKSLGDANKTNTAVPFTGAEIRAELRRRYMPEGGEAAPKIPDKVRDVLNQNFAFAQRGERLATFYDRVTRHVCVEYTKAPELYVKKTKAIVSTLKDAVKDETTSVGDFKGQAENVINELVMPNSKLNERRPRSIPDPHFKSATQRLVETARATLNEGVLHSLYRKSVNFARVLTGAGIQHDAALLSDSFETVDAGLSDAHLDRIPLTAGEKDGCVKRAALARGVFKKTLDYLGSRRYGTAKKEVMDKYIQKYVNGRNEQDEPYSAENLVNDLRGAAKDKTSLGERVGFWSSSTAAKLKRDLAHGEAFKQLSANTALAG